MAQIVTYLPDQRQRIRLDSAMRLARISGSMRIVRHLARPDELRPVLRSTAFAIVVFDPFGDANFGIGAWSELARLFPCHVFLAYAKMEVRDISGVAALARTGIDFVFVDFEDSRSALYDRIEGLVHRSRAEVLDISFGKLPDSRMTKFLNRLWEACIAPVPLQEAARFYRGSERTLRRRLRESQLPPLGRLIVWMRLLRAAILLSDDGRSVENVARTLCFPSPNAMRNQFARHVGTSLRDLRRSDRIDIVVDALRRSLPNRQPCQ